MARRRVGFRWLVAVLSACVGIATSAQMDDRQDNLPDPIPPPIPRKAPPKDAPKFDSLLEETDEPWEMPAELLASLKTKAGVYEEYARKFTCDEEARLAEYKDDGTVDKERLRRYGYLLLQDPEGRTVNEFRQELGRDGKLKGVVEDSEPFPPAYAWVFLFTEFHEPYFEFRLVDTRFDGFDLVHEIEFKGSLSFTDGKDIRQWEGRALLDAFTFAPLEIQAEPLGQRERLEALYRLWAKSFNVLGFRTGKAPLGYRGKIDFGYRRHELSFPTSLRYDTHRAVSPTQIVPVRASTRTYSRYVFFGVEAEPSLGDVVGQPGSASPSSGEPRRP